jgi:hypothetical protein
MALGYLHKRYRGSSTAVERLAPGYPPRATMAPHSLDGVLLPTYILRCLRCLFYLSMLPALSVLPAYAICAACGLAVTTLAWRGFR